MLVFKFHDNRRQFFFLLRRVPPLDFSAFYLKSGFLPIKALKLWWQMVFLTNSDCYNMNLLTKINRPLGIFHLGCIILQHTVSRYLFREEKIQTETSSLTTFSKPFDWLFWWNRSKQPIKWLENVVKDEVSVWIFSSFNWYLL